MNTTDTRPIRIADIERTPRGARLRVCPWCEGTHRIKYPGDDPDRLPIHVPAPCRPRRARLRLVEVWQWQ